MSYSHERIGTGGAQLAKRKVDAPESQRDPAQAQAIDDALEHLYAELCGIAAKISPDARFISPQTLVHDAYLRLRNSSNPKLKITSETHFKFLAARTMRFVLHDLLRKRRRHVTLVDAAVDASEPIEAADLERALSVFEKIYPRRARAIEAKYYGGLTLEEIAIELDIGLSTVKSDLRFAEAYIRDWIHKNSKEPARRNA